MSTLDWLLLLLLALTTLQGIWRGFIREVSSFAGWVAALLLAPTWAARVGGWLPFDSMGSLVREIAGFVLTVVAILVVVNLLARLIQKVASTVGLGALDRSLGGLFGFSRGALLVLLLVLILQQTPVQRLSFWQDAQGVTIALRLHRQVQPYLPPEVGRFITSCAELLGLLVLPQSTN